MRVTWVVVIGGIVGFVSVAAAQQRPEPQLRAGLRVRYEIPRSSVPFHGMIEEVDTLRIVVRPEGSDLRVQLGLDSLRSLAIFHGIRSSADGAWRGTKAGFQIGLLVGVLATTVVWLSPADERCDCIIPATASVAVLSVLGTLGLSLLGGLMGASAPGELWTEIPLGVFRRPRP